RQLIGEATLDHARALVREARRFAPGLAMQCASSVTVLAVQGLVGLVLTRRAMERSNAGAVTVALDQHPGLLRGSGKRGDVIAFARDGKHVTLRAGEAKLSAGTATAGSQLVANAKVQLESTLQRAHHLQATHGLERRVRNQLIQTLTHHIEMADSPGAADALLAALLDRDCSVELDPLSVCEVHAWGLDGGDPVTLEHDEEPRCFVHSEEETRRALEEMLASS
ncbi:MAG: hypothetical protein RLP09_25685, partial [Sandaracinaceae bacterium]